MILLPLIIIGVIVWMIATPSIRERFKNAFGGKEKQDPLNITKERYARGEITKEEFERIKNDLA